MLVARRATIGSACRLNRLGQRLGGVRPAGVRPLPGTAARRGDTEYWWTVATRVHGARTGPFARPSPFVTIPRTGRLARGLGDSRAVTTDARSVHLRPHDRRPSARARSSAPPRSSPRPTSTSSGSTATCADAGPSFSYPDEQYVQATDVTRLVRAGRDERLRSPPPLVRRRPGSPRGPARPARADLGAPPRRLAPGRRHRRDVARATGGVDTGNAAQRRGRLHRGHRRPPPSRWRGRRRDSMRPAGSRSPFSARSAWRPSPTSSRSGLASRPGPSGQCRFAACRPARPSRTTARSTPRHRSCGSATAPRGAR